MPPNIIAALKLWKLVHIDLIGTYSNSIIQHHPGGTIINKDVILTCRIIIYPATGLFRVVEVSCFDLANV